MFNKVHGSVLGSAIGDALGSPFEFLGRREISAKFPGGPTIFLDGQPGSLMSNHTAGDVSDDTYMSLAVLLGMYKTPALLDMSKTWEEFKKWHRSNRFRKSAPGMATTEALVTGYPQPSEGNGACMKAHISAMLVDDIRMAIQHAQAVARLTHASDETGMNDAGAALVVLACRYGAIESFPTLEGLHSFASQYAYVDSTPLGRYFDRINSINLDKTMEVSGWVFDTVSYAIKIWLNSPSDFLKAVSTAVLLGGDTDTTAAVVGGIAGAHVGVEGLPKELLDELLIVEELEEALTQCWERKSLFNVIP